MNRMRAALFAADARSKAMRVGSVFVFCALACAPVLEPLAAPAPLPAAPNVASSAAELPPPAPPAPPGPEPKEAPAAAAPATTVHPVVERFVRKLSAWDPELAASLKTLELGETAGTDTLRTLRFLEDRLRRRLVIPALEKSNDPSLRRLAADLTRIGAYQDAIAHLNLKMGPFQPKVCEGCYAYEQKCDQRRCEREQSLLLPAGMSAAGLEETVTFEGHPEATSEGVRTSSGIELAEFLNAVEQAGMKRVEIRARLLEIARALVLRSRNLERSVDPIRTGTSRAASGLRAGFERWSASYSSPPLEPGWGELAASEGLPAALSEELPPLRRALLRRFAWMRADADLDGEACDRGSPKLARQCRDTVGAIALLESFVDRVDREEGRAPAQELALALELLTLSELPSKRTGELVTEWVVRAARRSGKT
jgi:hypothetical protein